MTRVALLLTLFLPLLASAQDAAGTVRRWSESQALSRAAPSSSCLATSGAEGMDLRNVRSFRVILEAESGQTLSAGTLLAYVYDFSLAAWVRNPDLDKTVSVTSGTQRRQAWPDQSVIVRTGCVLYATSSVTASGGTTATVRIVAWTGGA